MLQHAVKYRPDIDGLRCIAVLSVLIFHMAPAMLPGGFVGVDIFFVISGYLITQTLWQDVEGDRFSLTKFYERRLRRIFPALIFMLAITCLAAAVLLMPLDFRSFSASLVSTVLFVSNLYFFWKTGYFDQAAQLKPLLHTWSLAVEEQYYTFFPILLYFIRRMARPKIAWILCGLAIVSFLVSAVSVVKWPSAAFYLPFGRIWELLVGAVAALTLSGAPKSQKLREAMGWAGFVLMAGSIGLLNEKSPFPGALAIPVTLGTALVIFSAVSGKTTLAGILSHPVLTWFGKISYSLYLWHWPLLAFFTYTMRRGPQGYEILICLGLVIALAWFSQKFIEAPFRTGHFRPLSTGKVFGASFAAASVLLGVGLAGLALRGLPQRFAPPVRAYASVAYDTNPLRGKCDQRKISDVAADRYCIEGVGGTEAPRLAYLGDSFGDALAPGIAMAARSSGENAAVLTYSGCYPLMGLNQRGKCRDFMDTAYAAIHRRPSIKTVVLVARWTSAYSGTRFGEKAEAEWYLTDDLSKEKSYPETKRVFVRALDRTLDNLKGYDVVILFGIPEQDRDVPRALALAAQLHQPLFPGIARSVHEGRQGELRALMAAKARQYNARLVDLTDQMCDASYCYVRRNDVVLYADDNHLSRRGAETIGGGLAPLLAVSSPVPTLSSR